MGGGQLRRPINSLRLGIRSLRRRGGKARDTKNGPWVSIASIPRSCAGFLADAMNPNKAKGMPCALLRNVSREGRVRAQAVLAIAQRRQPGRVTKPE